MRSKKKEEEEQTFTLPYLHKQKKYIRVEVGVRATGERREARGLQGRKKSIKPRSEIPCVASGFETVRQ